MFFFFSKKKDTRSQNSEPSSFLVDNILNKPGRSSAPSAVLRHAVRDPVKAQPHLLIKFTSSTNTGAGR